nr:retrovirus-related Pol polyprotein from transposon TNT 1-94 [Tanacetum cinerariifolium]
MRVESVNGKKYILVIMDDYSRFTWVKFLHNGFEFVNQTLRDYYEEVSISHETSVACSPQQNGVVERRNRTLIEAARTMLIYAQAPLFLWAEAVATACFTQNRSIIRLRHGKTPYELMHGKQPDLSYFHVFGALCYPTNDARTMLIYAQAPLFLWEEAMATVCFIQNRSIIRLRQGKTLYELLHSKLPDL